MAGKIFINYRRGDDPGFAGRIFDQLEQAFPPEQLFMDVDNIAPGLNFVEVLGDQVAQCDALIAVVGKGWIDARDKNGQRRLDNPDDFVRIEIESGLRQKKRVIPLLVNDASMPRAEDLPEPMREFAVCNAVRLTHERFRADAQGLVKALRQVLADAESVRAARTETERRAAAEVARRKQEEEARAAEAQRQAEERARQQAVAGLSAEEIRKAEELANWDFIKSRASVAELRNHLARFPGGVTLRYALTALEELVWAGLGAAPDIAALKGFLGEFPEGAHGSAAKARLADLEKKSEAERAAEELKRRETEAWAAASGAANVPVLETFLRDWPKGEYAAKARAEIRRLKQGPTRGRLAWAAGMGGFLAAGLAFFAGALPVNHMDAYDAVRPLPAFREPEMVTVPAGEFMMGSPVDQVGAEGASMPQHKVTIAKPFEVGKYEVTFDEWDHCVKDGGCKHNPSNQGWGRGWRPVIRVSLNDAKEYIAWLNKKTRKTYRLPTEAEWEYAARAGGATPYPWGGGMIKGQANCEGCGILFSNRATVWVGSYAPNAFGLYDVYGNVWEWVEDCFHESYNGAPSDGSAWTKNCAIFSGIEGRILYVIRGGAWSTNEQITLTKRGNYPPHPDERNGQLGFRLARTL